MTIVGTIIAFIVTIAFLVVIHEWGHFFAARRFGVWVHQFAIGMGPAIWKRKRGETEYSFRLLPIGGYVRMAGEDREGEEDRAVPPERLFTAKPAWQRMIIVLAGPVANIIAAVVIMIAVVSIFGLPYLEVAGFVNIAPDRPSPAEGRLQIGDKIERVQNETIYSIAQLQRVIRAAGATPIEIEVRRGAELIRVTVTPAWSDRDGRYIIGVNFAPFSTTNRIAELKPEAFLARQGLQTGDRILSINGVSVQSFWQIRDLLLKSERAVLTIERGGQTLTLPPILLAGRTEREIFDGITPEVWQRRPNLFEAIALGVQRSWDSVVALYNAVRDIFAQRLSPRDALSGPVGIAGILGQALQFGWVTFFSLVALLSLNLGLFNLLPIPALDGSRIVFLLIEMIRRKPIPPEREGLVHYIGFIVLMGLIVLITYNDIMRLFGR
ncbi:MAG: RIP metalloprotease RseP [Candidatus Bipolaricaulota bacterium]|nr:RIP metalloprotease RseP [Candidatus Bipolaricaulota bacterium]MCS7274158.1 RIP metalloprotease RseP [Candidatus Bipolaricaulota bacterium]MDW8111429.1 RIP metalloprotease RseP [Candidatus Bipolaricaulota bacterium]MDW8329902.1 RIP metalloprotease RseP [Candidatus Bipolaricaulota bacterium]